MRRVIRRDSGQALTEFIIVFPVLLYFTLIIIQASFIYNAYQVVNYSAYCAARAGVVYDADMWKMKKAAAIATIPIAGRKLPFDVLPQNYDINLPEIPGVIDADDIVCLLLKYRCACIKTKVILDEKTDDEITVTAIHHFQLVVPGVGVLVVPLLRLWDMPLYDEAKASTRKFGAPHIPVKASCTLPM